MFGVVMRMKEKKENHGRSPTQLRKYAKQRTGLSFNNVQMRYNSDLPAKPDAQTCSGGVARSMDIGREHLANEGSAGKRVAIIQRMRNNVVQRCNPSGHNDTQKGGKVPGTVTYGELDSLGRATGMHATITQDMIGMGTPANQSIRPAGFGGQAQGHARGHLLGRQLGGSGDDSRNLMTILQNPVNHPNMSSIEGKVKNEVKSGHIVDYTVTPEYKGDNSIPDGITIRAQGSGGLDIYLTLLNRK